MDMHVASEGVEDTGEAPPPLPNPVPPHQLIDQLFITTPPAQVALTAIATLLKYGHRADSCDSVLITGPSRVGKSAMLRHFAAHFPQRIVDRQIIRPVVKVKVREAEKAWSLVSALLRELGDPRPDHGSPGARNARAVALLRLQQVQLVIFDEFQQLIDSDTDRIAYRTGETVKTLLEDNVCPVVMCGVSHAERVLHTNRQLSNRARLHVEMMPADWRHRDDQLAFRVFLNLLEEALHLPTPSSLGELGTAHCIHHFSRGLYGQASNLVREALLLRYLAGDRTPCITREQLADAADGLLSCEPVVRINAFRTAPPDDYAPAPLFESLKEPRRTHGGRNDVDF